MPFLLNCSFKYNPKYKVPWGLGLAPSGVAFSALQTHLPGSNKGLLFGVILPAAVLLRFPVLIVAVLRLSLPPGKFQLAFHFVTWMHF